MFKQLTDKINYSLLELEILKFWNENKIFEKSISTRKGKPGFTFYEGPPTANGMPGLHHVMSRTLKDLVCRYKTMRGYQVHRKAGWDTHGLPVEIEVEKMLGFKHKDDIIRYGVAKFNEECKKSVWKYKAEWEKMTERMGYWVDLGNPYITFTNEYIESIWWALKQYFDKGMIYKDYKVQPYCPRCETPLSSHEVSLGYEEVKDLSAYVRMKMKGEDNTYFLAWTTQPWTLIPNVALVVHPDIDYVKVEHKGEKLILAESRLSVLDGEHVVLERFKGSSLAGKEYERVFNYHQAKEKGWYVVEGEFVSAEEGSGIVQISTTYGEDDYQMGKKYGLPIIHPVNKSGEFGPEVTDFAGKFVKDADPEILENLKRRGLLFKKEMYLHSYPFCWRCDTPLLYYARDSWYIGTTRYARRMVELNRTINWVPREVGEGRFGNWLEENKDWSLSRDRFWGTPLPIWICDKCGAQECIGSIAELEKRSGKKCADLHKPFVDELTWKCTRLARLVSPSRRRLAEADDSSERAQGSLASSPRLAEGSPRQTTRWSGPRRTCSGTRRRTPELIDVWFDSGAMPFAQWHYPFENKETFQLQHPADYICEGIDQTRGWFYSLHAISSFLFDKPAYKNILVNELVLDKKGQKMSKSKGNTVDPFAILEKYGADTTRWYLVTSSPPWRPTLFDEDGLVEVQRKFFGTLLNTYSFFVLYANIDGFTYVEPPIPLSERQEIDRWIISSLHSLIRRYEEAMEEYDVTKAARAVSNFTIDQLSNWYVRRNRRRFWSTKSDKGKDKTAAYQTLYECLLAVSKLMAPCAPFLADELHRNLALRQNLDRVRRSRRPLESTIGTRKETIESVHLSMLPSVDESAIDAELEERMEKAQRIVSLVRAIRNRTNLKVRQPLKRVIVPVANASDREAVKQMESLILEEINVKAIEYVSDDSEIVHKRAKPNFRAIGPKHGKSVQVVANAIKGFTLKEIRELEAKGQVTIAINGSTVVVTKEDVEILHEDIKGWHVESDNELTVALDTELTEELINEGMAREFVNRVQNMRKEAGFEVIDRIRIYYSAGERMHRALSAMKEYVQRETLGLVLSDKFHKGEYSATWEIDGERCEIGVERAR